MNFGRFCSLALLAACSFLTACSNNNVTNPSTASTTPQHLYVVSNTSTTSAVTSYAVNSSSPTVVSTLTSPTGQTWYNPQFDSTGNLYVASQNNTGGALAIYVYAPGSTGAATPIRTITSSYITAYDEDGLAVAPNGTIYYSDDDYGLLVFPPLTNGVATPTVINTHYYPEGGGFDAAGNYFFASYTSISMLPANFTASTTAITITPPSGCSPVDSVNTDSVGNLYAVCYSGNHIYSIKELPHTTTASTPTPINSFTLPSNNTNGFQPVLDSAGNVYYVTAYSPAVAVSEFAAGATGTPSPINSFTTSVYNNHFENIIAIH